HRGACRDRQAVDGRRWRCRQEQHERVQRRHSTRRCFRRRQRLRCHHGACWDRRVVDGRRWRCRQEQHEQAQRQHRKRRCFRRRQRLRCHHGACPDRRVVDGRRWRCRQEQHERVQQRHQKRRCQEEAICRKEDRHAVEEEVSEAQRCVGAAQFCCVYTSGTASCARCTKGRKYLGVQLSVPRRLELVLGRARREGRDAALPSLS
ncbi:unnamed protein product, partial [Phaeothamnion confervicola]